VKKFMDFLVAPETFSAPPGAYKHRNNPISSQNGGITGNIGRNINST
jgi:hypothetical protein